MADVAALSAGVLLRVAEFLKTLPAQDLDALAEGTAKLEVVGRGRAGTRPRAAAASTVDRAEVRQRLAGFTSVADATRYVDSLGLLAAPLRALAADLGVTVPAKATKVQIRDAIVRAHVGDVLNSEAIRRQATGR
jgi:hypothetical protein